VTGAGSRRKGHGFERWLVHRFREVFPNAIVQRGLQSRGGSEVPDVDVPGYHVEAKHHRKVNLRAALAQAIADAATDRVPIAVCKDNRAEPVVVLRLDDFLALVVRTQESASSRATPEATP
jgi:hypothetical protein